MKVEIILSLYCFIPYPVHLKTAPPFLRSSSMAALQKLSLPASSSSSLKPCRMTRFFTIPTNPSTVSYYRYAAALSVSRRLFIPSVSGIWDAITGGNNNARESGAAVRRGMLLFRQGDVAASLSEFDKAIELDPRQKAYLWQRGLSLYYLDRFEEGAEQFRIDVAQNPNDTEESIWCFLCEAQLYGVEDARKRFLEVGRDSRPVMRGAYNMFKDGGDPNKFASTFDSGNPSEYFYAYLYAGLYHESENQTDEAKRCLINASRSLYGEKSDDYMASLAKVHCRCRGWTVA